MISCEGMDRNVVIHEVLKKQNGTAIIPQGKTQTGRTVWEQPVAMTVQTFNQQIVVASQRATTHYSAEKRTPQNQEPVKSFQQQVLNVVKKLQRNRESEPDDFLYCMEVIKEINKLKNNKYLLHIHDKSNANYRFMILQLADIYENALGPALGALKSRAEDGCLWIYKYDLNMMAQIFRQMIPNNAVFKAILSELYRKHINQELDDMEHLIEFLPEEKTFFDHISEGISYLTDDTSPVCYIPLLDNHTLEEFKKRQEKLLQDANSHIKDGKASKDQEELDKLRKTVPKAITEIWNKRKHHEQLFEKFRELMPDKQDKDNKVDKLGIHFLKKITKLCDQYDTVIGEPHTKLKQSLVGVTSVSAKLVLLEIQDTDTTDQVRVQSLKVISHLSDMGWLKKGCNDLYLNYLKLQQDETNTKITYFEFNQRMDHIYTLLKSGKNDSIMLALEKLKEIQPYEQHLPEIDIDDMLQNRIRNAKNKCVKLLFNPILDSYREFVDFSSPDESPRKVDTKMRQYKSDFIKLNPYTFILASNKAVKGWMWRACTAWHDDIDRLRNATSFSEKDINDLLQLKDIAPSVPNLKVLNDLQPALTNIFQFALKDNTGLVSIEKVARLSEWVDLLSKDLDIHQKLRECNEEWKKKYKSTICDRTMTSSDTSPLPPVFVHPHSSLNTCSCHSHTEQQIAPNMMRPVTALFYMPAPATQQPFQQSVPVPCYTATEQTPAGIKPQSEQPLQAYYEVPTPGATMASHSPVYPYPQPTPPYIPSSAINQPFQLSTPALCYTATEQTPAGIKPQSEQPLQVYYEVPTDGQLPGATMASHSPVYPYPQPTPPYIPASAINQPFQLSAPALCYTATEQTPVGIRPQSEQPLQAYYEVPTDGQLPEATMVSHSPVYPYPQPTPPYIPASAINQPFQLSAPALCYTATEQTPVGIRPQSEQPLQAYYEVPTDGQLPEATMVSHSPVYPQPAPPYIPAPTTQQPFQQSVSTPYYTVTEQTPVGIRPQSDQPLQLQPLSAYHEVPTNGQLPGAPMMSHFPVNPYAPQLLVYEQAQPKWQPVYQQPYENQSTISSEPGANYLFSSNTQLSEVP